MNRLNKQLGISLVEILVALVISVFLLAGIVQVYTGNKAAFSFTNALAEIQENGRFALDTMSQDLRLAGEWGCIEFDSTDTDNINNTIAAAKGGAYVAQYHDFVGEEAIEGTDGATDTIIVRGGRPGQANVENPFEIAASADLVVTKGGDFGQDDIILVARCGANDLLIDAEADILEVVSNTSESITKNRLVLDGNKSQVFEKDAMVIELQTVTYSIGAGVRGPALFRQVFDQAPVELVEGVEDMQIRYGIDDDGDGFANVYLPASNALDYEQVVSVRVQLLVRSLDDFVTEDAQTYTFNAAPPVTPADRRIRQVFGTTIALRNRIGSI
ncbi:MAG: hypothetical protein GY802_17030 [Gammaproteobacteria bacterium]|nr:hypothetical protein [Gammaproteobacteria bacterium]